MAKAIRTAAAVLAALVVLALTLALMGFAALSGKDLGTPSAAARSSGNDAVWLGHAWVDGRKQQADIARLATTLRAGGFRDVFVHAGPLSDDGSLDPSLRPAARGFVATLHRLAPGIRISAWLGDVVGGRHLRLSDAGTRARVVASDRQVLADGFDGVHYDLEPIASGDAGYLQLLDATHAMTTAAHKWLSASVDKVEPLPGLHWPQQWVFGRPALWSKGYLRQVASRVDQVAVMAYDTGMPTQGTYTAYVREETALALDAVPRGTSLLIGVPAFHTDDFGHVNSAETVAAAIRGVRLGVGAGASARPFGVALYVDYAATPGDWATYQRDWVRR